MTHSRLSDKRDAGLPNFRNGQLMTESAQREFKDKSQYDTLPILSQSNLIRQVYLDRTVAFLSHVFSLN